MAREREGEGEDGRERSGQLEEDSSRESRTQPEKRRPKSKSGQKTDLKDGTASKELTQADRDNAASRIRHMEAKSSYGRGREISTKRIKDKKLRANLQAQEKKYKDAMLKARDAEILLENESGLLETEHELERTYRLRQDNLKAELPVQTAQKGFDLKLDEYGPYVADYTRNGRDLLLAGRKGHIATMDWRDGKLGCELQLGETVRDAKWLHNNQYFAAAQKKYVYIYDGQGVEIHKLEHHIDVKFMEFLPYHFLLASIGNAGYLKYTDTSTGAMVTEIPTRKGSPTALGQNPYNAILHVGHQNGQVSLWSPNSTEPLVRVLAHRGPVRSLAIDREGRYMVSTGQDQKMSIWDIRMFKELNSYSLFQPGSSVSISDRGLTAVGWGTQTTVYNDLFHKPAEPRLKVLGPYMSWGAEGQRVESVRWCPFDDVLGISHDKGYSSIIVPGAGEPNYDALEINPYENVKQRQETEVRGLLNKLQPEMISLNPDFVGNLDLASTETRKREREESRTVDDTFEKLKNKARGKNSSLKKYLRKKGSKNIIDERKVRLEELMSEHQQKQKANVERQKEDYGPALARFARKNG